MQSRPWGWSISSNSSSRRKLGTLWSTRPRKTTS